MKKTHGMGVLALLAALILSGCSATQPTGTAPGSKDRASLTAVPTPSTSPSADSRPLASAYVNSVLVTVYPASQFRSSIGCGCKVNDTATEELFPAGTPVVLLRISLSGQWQPSQGDTTTQDVTGTKLTDTRFDGRPELAVLDPKDGFRAARKLHLPWLPAGLFAGHSIWTVPNGHERSFAAAWYVPQGVDRLLLSVDIPSEHQPTHLFVDLPEPVLKLLSQGTD